MDIGILIAVDRDGNLLFEGTSFIGTDNGKLTIHCNRAAENDGFILVLNVYL